MSKSNQGKRKDWFLPAVISVAAIILIIIGYFIVSPIIGKVQSEEYFNQLTLSINSAKDDGQIIASYQGEEWVVDDGTASYMYSMLMNFGQGMTVKNPPDESSDKLEVRFPDGSLISFGETTVDRGARTGRSALYVAYQNTDGKIHDYYTDLTDFWKFKNQLFG